MVYFSKNEFIEYYATWRKSEDPFYLNEAAKIKEDIKIRWKMTDQEIDTAADLIDQQNSPH